ncbi:MAG: ABC transporter permease subunit [Clostridia bacterium]|nr:ABC transporter permease subunit [Clostridia bacterium]
MTVFKHELSRGRTSFAVWTVCVALLLSACVCLFPEMKGEMENVSDIFSSMGSFTAAFGMDRLDFGTLLGYYSIECGNVIGLGGAFFACLTASVILSKEEKDGTAEFLLTHPISRRSIVTQKLMAVFAQITGLNAIVFLASLASMRIVGEEIPFKEVILIHLAYYLMQLELGGIAFGISAASKRGSMGFGLGLAGLAYCLNLIANIAENVRFLKYFTPFAFCEGADIINNLALETEYLIPGAIMCLLGITAAYFIYLKKDIA